MLRQEQKRILSLIRCSLCGKNVDVSLFASMNEKEWIETMNYAKYQGVTAICFSAFEKSTESPPLNILQQWFARCVKLETMLVKKKSALLLLKKICKLIAYG